MKPHYNPLATALAATLQLAALAAVPLAWDVRPGQPAPVTFDRYHGETIDFSATFRGFGALPFAPGADVRLWYQTNGMGQAWWSVPATIQSNVLSATWSPALDPGADRVSLFFGAPSNAYASAVLRLRHSPGFAPGTMPDPETFHESDPVFSAWLSAFQESDPVFSSWLATFEVPETSLEPSTNYTDRALGAFAATGAVARAATYGTPTRWTDATGCVWEVTPGWRVYTNGVVAAGWTAWGHDIDAGPEGYSYELRIGPDEAEGVGIATATFPSNVQNWADEYDVTYGLDYDFYGLTYGDSIRAVRGETNLVGRVALTNDIPPEQEWPAELVHTNTPLIFADGEDTNVTSIALRAQPENYTSLSFLSPVSYYLPNRFSLLELGHDYQIAAAQWFQVGRYLYAQNPENIVFVGGGQHRSLQDYLDACSPQTMADLLSCYIPTNGGGRIHGDLTIDGRLTAGELITITNSDIHAKGFQVVNKVLTADGLMASNGMVRLNCARFVIGFGTPRIHLETNDLSAITYGGTWENPAGSVFSWQDSKIQNYLAGDIGQQDIELRNPYMRYMDVKDGFMGWKIKGHNVNNGPLKHFTLDNYRTHHFTDADVGNYGIEFTIASNAHVRIVYDFASAPPSAVYFFCGRDGNDESATMLSNGTELLAPTAGVKTLLEIEHLSGWTFIVKETPLTYQNTVMPWIQAQEEEP